MLFTQADQEEELFEELMIGVGGGGGDVADLGCLGVNKSFT